MRTVDILLPSYKPHPGWETNIVEAMESLRSHFAGTDAVLSLTIVNDGSPLEFFTEDALDRIRRAADGRFRFLTYTPNHGKGYCLRHGVAHATGEILVYTDTDFPFGWKSVADAIECLLEGKADVVMGQRTRAYAESLSPMRRLLSATVRKFNRLLLGLPDRLLDAQSGLKGFNARGRAAFLDTTVDTFVFDSEFIMMAWNRGLAVETVRLELRPGLRMSRMGFKVMLREGLLFLRVFLRNRIFSRKGKRP